MSETVILAILVALPPTIASIGALVVAIRNGRRAKEIHTLVNGQLTAVREKLTLSTESVDALKKELASSIMAVHDLRKDLSISQTRVAEIESANP